MGPSRKAFAPGTHERKVYQWMPASDVVRITPYRDGPLLVRGPVELLDGHGEPIPTRRSTVALCRCGKSRLRPFCDGTHKLVGFSAPPFPQLTER